MSRVLLKLRYDATSGTVVAATATAAVGRCPRCTDPELEGWLARSCADDATFVEEPEVDRMNRMCEFCLSSPSPFFCDGSCEKVGYEEFQRGGFEALCGGCDGVMRGAEWAATCNRCDGVFCGACVARVQTGVCLK
jgi:hypothetical protein